MRRAEATSPGAAGTAEDPGARETTPLRVLVVTTLFPNRARPGWAPFNRQQLAALARLPGVEVVDVLATLPWFPAIDRLAPGSLAAGLGEVPAREEIDGLAVRHPRTLYLPRVGHGAAAALFASSLLPTILAYRGRADVLLAAWAHPDGCAAVALGRVLGVPVVVKVHGSDLNVAARRAAPRFVLRRLLPRAARVVAVSRSLARAACALGVAGERVDVVRNGVDPAVFRPRSRDLARRALALGDAPLVVCPGRLERAKGVFDLLDAFAVLLQRVPAAELVFVGDGRAREELRRAAHAAGCAAAIRFAGGVPLDGVARWLAAADVVAMPSWSEGIPNTILEALACGRPVVATDVGGVREVLDDPALGTVVPGRDPRALAAALGAVLAQPGDAERIAAAGLRTWEASAGDLLRSLVAARATAPARAARRPPPARALRAGAARP